jgi:hypothetical protein
MANCKVFLNGQVFGCFCKDLIVITQSKLTLKEIFGDLLKHKTNQFVD